jgi:hypothetical protein
VHCHGRGWFPTFVNKLVVGSEPIQALIGDKAA